MRLNQCCGSGTGSETFGRIRIRSGTEINVSDPDLNPDTNQDLNPKPKLDPKKI
jgi:hypothetical protein